MRPEEGLPVRRKKSAAVGDVCPNTALLFFLLLIQPCLNQESRSCVPANLSPVLFFSATPLGYVTFAADVGS